MSGPELTAGQLRALFDILTHSETYREIEAFKIPETVAAYGRPFVARGDGGISEEGTPADKSGSPLLQLLLVKFVLSLPGISRLTPGFWSARVQGMLERLAGANLSESYDKGALGARKTLATAASAIVEAIARGVLGGYPGKNSVHLAVDVKDAKDDATSDETIDVSKDERKQKREALHIVQAWENTIRGLIQGDLVDDIFTWLVESEDLEDHSEDVKGAVDYCIIHLATFLHQVFVLSPEGEYLIKLIETVNRLIPYPVIKQTLRVSNAATVIGALLRVFLAKVSVTAVTNWIGITQNPDDGQNLLQKIISTTLSWDSNEFRKIAERIEKSKGSLASEILSALREHMKQPREVHAALRQASIANNESIVMSILAASDISVADLSEEHHTVCMEYYSAMLSVRDRDEITIALCRQPNDLLTQAVKEVFAAFDPMIRKAHDNVDLRDYVEAARAFIDDFLKTWKYGKGALVNGNRPGRSTPVAARPAVEDYVDLIRRHRHILYSWLHVIMERCPDICEEYRAWAIDAAHVFRGLGAETTSNGNSETDRSIMENRIQVLFNSVPEDKKEGLCMALDAHDKYLSAIEDLSIARMQAIAAGNGPGCMAGSGMYLARWQALLDETRITPEAAKGEVRRGKDVKDAMTLGKVGAKVKGAQSVIPKAESGAVVPDAPDVSVVTAALGERFREMLVEMTSELASMYTTGLEGKMDAYLALRV